MPIQSRATLPRQLSRPPSARQCACNSGVCRRSLCRVAPLSSTPSPSLAQRRITAPATLASAGALSAASLLSFLLALDSSRRLALACRSSRRRHSARRSSCGRRPACRSSRRHRSLYRSLGARQLTPPPLGVWQLAIRGAVTPSVLGSSRRRRSSRVAARGAAQGGGSPRRRSAIASLPLGASHGHRSALGSLRRRCTSLAS